MAKKNPWRKLTYLSGVKDIQISVLHSLFSPGSDKKSLLVGETQKIIYSNCARSRVILTHVRDHLEIEASRTRLEVGQYYDSLMVLLR